jgi:hypothetical protein
MECLLDRVLPRGTDHLVISGMVRFHVRDELYENGRIDVAKLQPLGRLDGNYTKVGTISSCLRKISSHEVFGVILTLPGYIPRLVHAIWVIATNQLSGARAGAATYRPSPP